MKAIIEHIVLVTRLLGAPVSEAALSAEVVRDKKLKVNYHSLVEVLRSHGFENTLSKRNLEDIPSLAVPVMIILHNEEAAVITKIEGSGQERKYHIRQVDGLEQELSHEQLSGCIWVTAGLSNPKWLPICARSCLNIICPKHGFGKSFGDSAATTTKSSWPPSSLTSLRSSAPFM